MQLLRMIVVGAFKRRNSRRPVGTCHPVAPVEKNTILALEGSGEWQLLRLLCAGLPLRRPSSTMEV